MVIINSACVWRSVISPEAWLDSVTIIATIEKIVIDKVQIKHTHIFNPISTIFQHAFRRQRFVRTYLRDVECATIHNKFDR
jgi:hypothetical protein